MEYLSGSDLRKITAALTSPYAGGIFPLRSVVIAYVSNLSIDTESLAGKTELLAFLMCESRPCAGIQNLDNIPSDSIELCYQLFRICHATIRGARYCGTQDQFRRISVHVSQSYICA